MGLCNVRGEVWVRKNGLLVAHGKNLVVQTGLEHIAARLGGVAAVMSHLAIGNNGAASSVSTTGLLGTEIERTALDPIIVNTNTVTYSATVGATIGVTQTVREAGIFDAAAGGNMLSRFICAGFDLSAGETAFIEWAITIGT